MKFNYSSMTRVLVVQHGLRIKTYRNINLFGIDDCIKEFVNSWGYRHG